jgi:hypothetical protein
MRNKEGKIDPEIMIHTTQSRVYMAAGEVVALTIQATDKNQQAVELFVTRAVAQGLSFGQSRAAPQVTIAMSDSGMNGDKIAQDGITTGLLNPAATGFSTFDGTIRTEVSFTVNGRAGTVNFDVIYSPTIAATWNGKISDKMEDGALVFLLPIQVQQAGRYIVNARLDDAQGKGFALLNFNGILQQGPNEIRLITAGNLIRDKQVQMPLTLRDVDGYLLKENVDPDRVLLARLEGSVYQSKNYPLKGFSDKEWAGEDRTRYLNEYGKDLVAAKSALMSFNPETLKQALANASCKTPELKGTFMMK